MEKLAGSYILKRIKQARTPESDTPAVMYQGLCGVSPAEYAKFFAGRGGRGDLANTASHLHLAKLPLPEKGEILAEAYTSQAEVMTGYAKSHRSYRGYERFAQAQVRIAQGLTRASKRA